MFAAFSEKHKVEIYRAENKDGRAIAEHFTKNGCWSKGIRSYAREHVPEKSRSEFIEHMSKIESGKVDLTEEEFNLSNLVDNLLTMTCAQINKHHHQLSVNISGVIHENVIGDSLRIQKVFTNLMSNAVKYTPDSGNACGLCR